MGLFNEIDAVNFEGGRDAGGRHVPVHHVGHELHLGLDGGDLLGR